MGLNVVIIPCLADNYAYLLRCEATGKTALVDAPESAPIAAQLDQLGWGLDYILITHHHDDHIAGVDALVKKTGAKTIGAAADSTRLPPLDHAVSQGDTITIGDCCAYILAVDGHTIGHIAFHFADDKKVFSADSLMALGCGRIFEGTQPQMWDTMCKFIAMDPETLVYSGHEYTQSNAKFAVTIEPNNSALAARAAWIDETRAQGGITVPATIGQERATNPFMRADLAEVKAAINMSDASDAAVFGEIRTRKDNF